MCVGLFALCLLCRDTTFRLALHIFTTSAVFPWTRMHTGSKVFWLEESQSGATGHHGEQVKKRQSLIKPPKPRCWSNPSMGLQPNMAFDVSCQSIWWVRSWYGRKESWRSAVHIMDSRGPKDHSRGFVNVRSRGVNIFQTCGLCVSLSWTWAVLVLQEELQCEVSNTTFLALFGGSIGVWTSFLSLVRRTSPQWPWAMTTPSRWWMAKSSGERSLRRRRSPRPLPGIGRTGRVCSAKWHGTQLKEFVNGRNRHSQPFLRVCRTAGPVGRSGGFNRFVGGFGACKRGGHDVPMMDCCSKDVRHCLFWCVCEIGLL